jgi:peptidoglycan hydrolase-like protein with peptidoglycan-binding domain
VAAAGEGAGSGPVDPVPDPPTASGDPATSPNAPVEAEVAESDAPSVVAGLDVAELAAVLDAPSGTRRRPAAGPVLERVEVSGASAWRLTVPGPVVVGGARAEVVVGERTVGVGVPAEDLASLVAVTLDPAGLEAGEPVRIRWPGRALVEAGALEVVR